MEEVIPKEQTTLPAESKPFNFAHIGKSNLPLISLVASCTILISLILGILSSYVSTAFGLSVSIFAIYNLLLPLAVLIIAVFTLILAMKKDEFLGKRLSIASLAISITSILLLIFFVIVPYIRAFSDPGIIY